MTGAYRTCIGSRPVSVLPVPGSPTFRWEPERSESLAQCVCRADHVNARAHLRPRNCDGRGDAGRFQRTRRLVPRSINPLVRILVVR